MTATSTALTTPMRLMLGLIGLVGSSPAALAFGQSPLRLEQPRGVLLLSNPSSRSIALSLQVFAVVQHHARSSAALTPLEPEQAERWIRLRPSRLRLGPGASRTIPYSVLDPTRDFFLCGVSEQGLFTLRVCSRWRSGQPPAASLPVDQASP
ncbi:MAG: hypothetical protein FJ057_10665 [Cyanobacteria bacterium K_DeepCast_0m_m1_088]|nr:hypothetical protein [Cyanobacteria bacterium K_DeepCast_0m_m1_088]